MPAAALLAVSAAFATLILVSALTNGAAAVTAAGKLVELAALTLGTVAFVDTRERLATLLAVVVVYTLRRCRLGRGRVRRGGRR